MSYFRAIPPPDHAPPLPAVQTRPATAAVTPPATDLIIIEDSALGNLTEFVRRSYWILLAALALGLVAAYAITRSQPVMYRAVASIEIQDFNENFLNLKEVTPLTAGPQDPYTNGDLHTQLRILESRRLLERVLSQLPQEHNQPPRLLRALWAKMRETRAAAPLTHDELLDQAARHLSVRESRQTRIVDISYDSEDPQYAASFVNRLAQAYMDQSVESRLEISRATTAWLGRQLEDMQAQLAASDKKLQDYARKSGLLVTAGDHRPAEDQLRQLQENLTKAQESRMAQQARLETGANSPADTLEGPAGSVLREYNTKLTELRRQRADLLAVYTPDFDGVKRLDGQIRALEAAVRTESATIVKSLQTDYDKAARHEKLLENSYLQQVQRVSEQSEKAVEYGNLKHEADTNRELYNTMLHRVAEARVASAMLASNARIVDPAHAPRRASSPNGPLNLMWGGMSGLLVGVMLGIGRENYNRRKLQPGDLGMLLRVPELGVMPKIQALSSGANATAWDGSRLKTLGIKPPDASMEIALATWLRRKSPVADSFRSIVASIVFSNQLGHVPQMIAVTSAEAGEGKTTVATNIAAALAMADRKVLLFDGNLRQPRLHHIFDQTNNYGFADLLTLPGENSGLLSYITHPTGMPNVWLATPGPHDTNGLDLLYSPGILALLERAREEFDLILIDTPAMADLPDARVLGRMADAVILVVKSATTDRQAAHRALARLQQDGIPVLGSVLNRWSE